MSEENALWQLRKNLGEVFHDLARQKESRIVEGHLQPDHVHMLLLIPPKYSVAHVVGYMKGKSAIYIARNYLGFGAIRPADAPAMADSTRST